MYTQYINNQDRALDTLSELRQKNKKFAKFLQKQQRDPRCHGNHIDSFLILPVQRVPRYKLLLAELLKNTDSSHADAEKLESARKQIETVAMFINEQVRSRENRDRVLEIQNMFPDSEPIVAPTRHFVGTSGPSWVTFRSSRMRDSTAGDLVRALKHARATSTAVGNSSDNPRSDSPSSPTSPNHHRSATAEPRHLRPASSSGGARMGVRTARTFTSDAVRVGAKTAKVKQLHLFLFNDMLMFGIPTANKKKDTVTFTRHAVLKVNHNMFVYDDPDVSDNDVSEIDAVTESDTKSDSKDSVFSFHVRNRHWQVTVEVSSQQEKQWWMTNLSELILQCCREAFLQACARGDEKAARQIADDQDLSVDCADNNGWTALHTSAHSHQLGTLHYLLQSGVEIDVCNKAGKTALMLAAEQGHADVVDLLIEEGANPLVRDSAGKSCLSAACSTYDRVRHAEALQRLLDHCLMYICAYDDTDALQRIFTLVNQGKLPSLQLSRPCRCAVIEATIWAIDFTTPLVMATLFSSTGIVQMLLDQPDEHVVIGSCASLQDDNKHTCTARCTAAFALFSDEIPLPNTIDIELWERVAKRMWTDCASIVLATGVDGVNGADGDDGDDNTTGASKHFALQCLLSMIASKREYLLSAGKVCERARSINPRVDIDSDSKQPLVIRSIVCGSFQLFLALISLRFNGFIDKSDTDGLSSTVHNDSHGYTGALNIDANVDADSKRLAKAAAAAHVQTKLAQDQRSRRTTTIVVPIHRPADGDVKHAGEVVGKWADRGDWIDDMISSKFASATRISTGTSTHVSVEVPPAADCTAPLTQLHFIDLTVLDNEEMSPLMHAAFHGRQHIARVLASLDDPMIDCRARNSTGMTALLYAAAQGHQKLVQLIAECTARRHMHPARVEMFDMDKAGRSALYLAAKNGHFHTSVFLAHQGVPPFIQDNEGKTALVVAANDQIRFALGTIALLRAAAKNDDHAVRELLEANCDVNQCDKQGRNAMLYAARAGHLEMVELLHQFGCRAGKPADDGWTALMYASLHGFTDIITALCSMPPEECNMEARSSEEGLTALLIAARSGHHDCFQILLSYGANRSACTKTGASVDDMMAIAERIQNEQGVGQSDGIANPAPLSHQRQSSASKKRCIIS
jgi:ankyrin repeat protein